MELLKDYDCTIIYYLGKANVIVDTLSHKSIGSSAYIVEMRRWLIYEIHILEVNGEKLEIKDPRVLIAYLKIWSILVDQIKNAWKEESQIIKRIKEVKYSRINEFMVDSKRVLRYRDQLCVPNVQRLKRSSLKETYHARYTVHPKITKMYQDLKQLYYWEGMKKDVANIVNRCLICQQVKVEHQNMVGL